VEVTDLEQNEIPELGEVLCIYHEYLARVAVSYALMTQHIVPLERELLTRAERIHVTLQRMYTQSPGSRKFSTTLAALVYLFTVVFNLLSGFGGGPVQALSQYLGKC